MSHYSAQRGGGGADVSGDSGVAEGTNSALTATSHETLAEAGSDRDGGNSATTPAPSGEEDQTRGEAEAEAEACCCSPEAPEGKSSDMCTSCAYSMRSGQKNGNGAAMQRDDRGDGHGRRRERRKGEDDLKEDPDTTAEDDDRRNRLFSLLPPKIAAASSGPDIFNSCQEAAERASLSKRERAEAHADVYGVSPPGSDQHRLEEAAALMDNVLDCIPPEERGALSRAREAFPFLFLSAGRAQSSSHVRVFLEAEEYDVLRAARRMVRYWSERERQLGDAAFEADAFSAPSDDDIVRMIQRRMEMSMDEELAGVDHGSNNGGGAETNTRTENEDDDLSQKVYVMSVIQDFQSRRIQEIDAKLARLPLCARAAWEDARAARPDLADTDAHKIIFLQCCDYDPRAAARRLANYWDMKYFLFGKERAFGPIAAADMLDGSNEVGCGAELEGGIVHLLPGTDAHGRGMLCFRADKMMQLENPWTIRVLRAAWYILHSAQYEATIRINGLVVIVVVGQSVVNTFDYHFFLRIKAILTDCVPIKCKAWHDCVLIRGAFTKMWTSTVVSVIKLSIGRLFRQRFWVHIMGSTDKELAAELANFEACGITKEQLPEVLGGSLDPEYIENFLALRRVIEEANGTVAAAAVVQQRQQQ